MQNKPKAILQLTKERAKKEGRRHGRRVGLKEGRSVGLQEGRQVGLQEGRQVGWDEGRKAGESQVLLRQLERKFGVVPADIRHRVQSATSEQLLEAAERVLEAKRPNEVFS